MSKKLMFCLAALLCGPAVLSHAQSSQSSVGEIQHLWVGGEFSNFAPDWGLHRLSGVGIYGDLGQYRRRYGIEGEVRFLTFNKTITAGLTEKSYLGGPFATIYRHGKLSANVKFLFGGGSVNFPGGIGYGSYFELVPGGNVEYRLSRKLKARVDYEYQFMPSAPGAILPPGLSHGLTPNGFSGGASYRIF